MTDRLVDVLSRTDFEWWMSVLAKSARRAWVAGWVAIIVWWRRRSDRGPLNRAAPESLQRRSLRLTTP